MNVYRVFHEFAGGIEAECELDARIKFAEMESDRLYQQIHYTDIGVWNIDVKKDVME